MTEDRRTGPNTRLFAAALCPGCQFSFIPTQRIEVCPGCGRSLDLDARAGCDTHLHHPVATPANTAGARGNASAAHEVDELIGQRIDCYSCDALLGAGAMGRVYLARHLDLHRKCALKILPPRLVESDPAYVERFANEGRAAAALNHPNIVTVHAIGEALGFYFLEMEFVAGRSLRKLVEDEGPQTPVRATALTLRIAEGLAAAHVAHILHRDLKPDNVMLTHHGVPKITDFGLAKRVIWDGESTAPREVVGTPHFMAPELFQQSEATPASDVYALGVCYYFLLTGRLPFDAMSVSELMGQVIHDPVPSVKPECLSLPLEMAECLSQMLSKAPGNRPRSGVEAVQLLQAVLGEMEDIETLLQQAFAHQPGVRWSREGERYRVQLEFAGGRRQTAFIEPSLHAAADRSLRISSVCCPALSVYFEPALRLNSEIMHGALAIAEMDGEAVFVMVDNYPRATVDAEEIRRSVLEVAHRADAIEKLLTGQDFH